MKHTVTYFLIRFAQTKITLFIFWNSWVIKENESFLLVEPCSRVTWCVEIKLQFFFRKYIYLYPTNATYFGNSLWHVSSSWWKQLLGKTYGLRCQKGAMANDSLAYGKTKNCRQHGSYVLGLTFLQSCLRMLSRNRKWCNKIIGNVTGTKSLIWLNIIGWLGGSLLRCNYYDEYLVCEQEDTLSSKGTENRYVENA